MLAKDMLDETFFRMPNLPTLASTGMSPIFLKNVTYSRKKDTFTFSNRKSFDSYKNMFIFYIIIHNFKDNFFDKLELKEITINNEPLENSGSIIENLSTEDKLENSSINPKNADKENNININNENTSN